MKSDSTFDKYFAQFSNQDLKEAQTIQQDLVSYGRFKTSELMDSVNENNIKILKKLKKELDYSKRQSQFSNLTYTYKKFQEVYYKNSKIPSETNKTFNKLYKYGFALAHKHLENESVSKFSDSVKETESKTKRHKEEYDKTRSEEEELIREYLLGSDVDKDEIIKAYKDNRINRFARDFNNANFNFFKQKIDEVITENRKGELQSGQIEKIIDEYSDEIKRNPNRFPKALERWSTDPTKTKKVGQSDQTIQEKVKKSIATELNAAYNIERINTYYKKGVKYVKWNLLPEHMSRSNSSKFAIGVVCERCFSRANGGFRNMGIYSIEEIISNPELYIPQHPYCGCFYSPLRVRKSGKGVVELTDTKGNRVIKVKREDLENSNLYDKSFSGETRNNSSVLEKSAVGLSALYLFLNRKKIANTLNLFEFKQIKDVVDSVNINEQIKKTVNVLPPAKEIEVTEEPLELVKQTGKKLTEIQKLNKQNEAEYSKEYEFETISAEESETNVSNTNESTYVDINTISKADENDLEKILRDSVDEDTFTELSQKINQKRKEINNKLNKISEGLKIDLDTISREELEDLKLNYSSLILEYRSKVAELDNLVYRFQNLKLDYLDESTETLIDFQYTFDKAKALEVLDEYQINSKIVTYDLALQEFNSKRVYSTFKQLEQKLNFNLSKIIIKNKENNINEFKNSDTFSFNGEDIEETVRKLVDRVNYALKNEQYFQVRNKISEMNTEDLKLNKKFLNAIEELNVYLSDVDLTEKELIEVAKNLSGKNKETVLELAKLKNKQNKLQKYDFELRKAVQQTNKQSYLNKIINQEVDEKFLTPAEKQKLLNKSKIDNSKDLNDYLIRKRKLVQTFLKDILNRNANDQKSVKRAFNSKTKGVYKYKNQKLKTILAQYLDGKERQIFEPESELFKKWENRKITIKNIDSLLADIGKLSKSEKVGLRDFFSGNLEQEINNLAKREFNKLLNTMANFENKKVKIVRGLKND